MKLATATSCSLPLDRERFTFPRDFEDDEKFRAFAFFRITQLMVAFAVEKAEKQFVCIRCGL